MILMVGIEKTLGYDSFLNLFLNLFFVGKVRAISSEISWLNLRHKKNFKRKA